MPKLDFHGKQGDESEHGHASVQTLGMRVKQLLQPVPGPTVQVRIVRIFVNQFALCILIDLIFILHGRADSFN